jgi:CubicO group peptidase (beta-lactamase class C family)
MDKSITRIVATAAFFMLLVSMASAQGLPKAKTSEEVGLSSERLKRISTWMKADIEKGVIPGAVVLIARQGKVAYFEAFGYRDREKNLPMTRDSIFRIMSMTKPFTSLAIMMLAEEGKIQLYYPVSRYLPEFKDLKVGMEKKDEATGKTELVLEPPKREMMVHDLLRHTSGLTYGFARSPIEDLYNAAKVFDWNQTNAELITKLSKLPLRYHPGTTWEYSMSTDILGRIVEVVSGMSFDAFIRERITKPLKQPNTGFWVEDIRRQTQVAELPKDQPSPFAQDVTKQNKWLSGGGGMVSTAADYARLCQMFLNGGTLDGVRLVSRKTVELMTTNHLPPVTKFSPITYPLFGAFSPAPENGHGFGLGFAVRTETGLSSLPGSIGDYSWAGALGTFFWIDPKEKLIAIKMMQAPAQRLHYRYMLRQYVYQAIVD